jgi:DNA primase
MTTTYRKENMTYALTDTIEELLGPSRGSAMNRMFSCPLHEDRTPSLSINMEEGLWKCHSCGEGGNIEKLGRIVGHEFPESFYLDRAISFTKRMDVLPVQQNFGRLANELYERGLTGRGDNAIRTFLRGRGIHEEQRHRFTLGWDGGRISFPYWEDDSRKNGTAYAIKYRDLRGHKSSEEGSRRGIYNVESVSGSGRVLICEGETDTILAYDRLAKTGIGVCGTPGASVSKQQWEQWALTFLWASDIMVALDADEAGDLGADRAIEVLGSKARRVRPDDGLDLSKHVEKYGVLPDGIA